MKRILNVEAVKRLVSQVESWRSLRLACGISHRGYLTKFCRRHQIDTSHFLTEKTIRPAKDMSEYLVKGKSVSSSYLKKRLLKAGIKKHVCEKCERTEWNGSPIPLDLHHVDGDRENNLLENIQLLCCNCHALTPNYCGANAKRNTVRRTPEEYRNAIVGSTSAKEACIKLGINPSGGNITTVKARAARYGLAFSVTAVKEIAVDDVWIERPARERKEVIMKPRQPVAPKISQEKLGQLLWEMPLTKIGERLGVSGNAVKRWCRKHQLALPPAGYWVRRNAGHSHEASLISQTRIRSKRNQPNEQQAREAYDLIQKGSSLRKASLRIGFHHETTKAALMRFGLIPKVPTRYERKKIGGR